MARQRFYQFHFHMNKPETQRAGAVRISVHWKGKCHIVENLKVLTHTWGKVREKQPRFIMCGIGEKMTMEGKTAVIV